MILRKRARKYGTSAHVIVPKHQRDKEVAIVYEEDLENLKALIRNTTLYDSVKDAKIEELRRQVDDLIARVGFIERYLPEQPSKGTKSSETPVEQESKIPEAPSEESSSEGLPPPEGQQTEQSA